MMNFYRRYHMRNEKKVTFFTFTTQYSNKESKKYNIKSEVLDDDEFDQKLDELMNQELAYGDTNYY